jgi:hypothetical protein
LRSVYFFAQPSDPAFHWVLPVLMAYCIADSMFMAIFEKDMLMTLHHIAVVVGVMPLYLAPHGWYLCIVSTFFAEITNPLQNTWAYAREYGPKTLYEVSKQLLIQLLASKDIYHPHAQNPRQLFWRPIK